MVKRKLTDEQEREVALSHLCHVSPEYIQRIWGVSDATVKQLILKQRSPNWNDPLVEFYRQVWKSRNYWGNAAHIYLVFNDQAEGLHSVGLINRKRDSKVYEAVDNNIFEPRTSKYIAESTGLGKILELPEKEKPEIQMLETIFGSFKHNQMSKIVMPYLYQRLRESCHSGEVDLVQVYREVRKDVLGYLHEALRMRIDKETKGFWDEKEAKRISELKGKLENVLNTLTYREKEIVKLRYGLGDGYTYTLEEAGKIFQVNRERVRQIEAKAIRKLQHPVRARMLEGFLQEREEGLASPVHNLKDMSNYTPEQRDLILKSSVDNFELSIRTRNMLEKIGIKNIEDVCNFSELDFLSYKNCGETTLKEIRETLLRPYGLDFKPQAQKKSMNS